MFKFTQLRAWQNARKFAVEVYRLTSEFPSDERYGLTAQIRRSSVSVSANIAEGFSRQGAKEKAQFYSIALGSLTETLSHAYIANDLGFLPSDRLQLLEEKVTDIHKMTNGLIKSAKGRTS
ncbi:hypothetical protein A3F37_00245 [Candidatus Saccharibacteria bacterium RIFCSPHIGHO2_12_FULL_41_12]|nr:MAG: hypothetical protein A3F37_00245 [Candidatus Saccharibacteria bacterium RIFCSPHIGHO2_12_FULL_41_12]